MIRSCSSAALRRSSGLLIAATAASVVAVAAPAATAATKQQQPRPASARLATFARCDALLSYARRQAVAHPEIVPVAGEGFGPVMSQPGVTVVERPASAGPQEDSGAATQGVDFSGTNTQEADVDEPDTVKTDGRRIFVIAQGRLHALAVSDGGKPRLVGSLALTGDGGSATAGDTASTFGYGAEMLLQGDRLLVIGTQYGLSAAETYQASRAGARASTSMAYPSSGAVVIAEVDVKDPAAMRITRSMTVDGRYVSARVSGDTARVVLTTPPQAVSVDGSGNPSPQQYEARRRAALRRAPLSTFRPRMAIRDRAGRTKLRGALPCTAIRRARTFSGLDTTTVLTFDLDKGLELLDSDAVLGAGDTVYASTSGLFVASQRYDERLATTGTPSVSRITTQIHRFAAGERGRTAYRASGSVPGYLLNQFSLSEHRGVLRVATTEEPVSSGDERTESSSTLTVLDQDGTRLVPVGRVGGLGKGERIYAVRFVDDVAYVVTFRQVDPLYTVDLSDPRAPRVLGELKILGYSAYLHPVGDDLLLGIGQDATPEGRRAGTQISLFDVSDLRAPRLVHQAKLGGTSSSSVEYDHKAFLWWAPRKTAVLPVTQYDSVADPSTRQQPFSGVYGYRVDRASGIDALGRVSDPPDEQHGYVPQITRTLVFGGRLVTVSERGLGVASLHDFERSAYLPFPDDPKQGSNPGGPRPAR